MLANGYGDMIFMTARGSFLPIPTLIDHFIPSGEGDDETFLGVGEFDEQIGIFVYRNLLVVYYTF